VNVSSNPGIPVSLPGGILWDN